MASNQARWVKNMFGAPGPLTWPITFAAGASQAVKQGELLDISSGNGVPLASDKDMSAGILAIAHEEIKSGDAAGYYLAILPRPGDVFEFAFTDADNPAQATAVYWTSSEEVTSTAGTNIIGHVVDHDGFPQLSGHASDDASIAAGTTRGNVSRVLITIEQSNSYFSQLQAD